MTSVSLSRELTGTARAVESGGDRSYWLRKRLESALIPFFALLVAAAAFSLFLVCLGKSPGDFFSFVWRGAFGSAFSLQNTLQRASPLLLTALCVALPAQLGLVVIGGEGAVVLGGLAAAGRGGWGWGAWRQRRSPR